MQAWQSKRMLPAVASRMWRYREYKKAQEQGGGHPAAGWARVIDEAVQSATPEMADFVRAMWLYAAAGRGSRGYHRYLVVARQLNISISTLYRWREEFLIEVMVRALRAGLLEP